MIRLLDEPGSPTVTGAVAERGSPQGRSRSGSGGQERKVGLSRLPGSDDAVGEVATITSPTPNRMTSPLANRTTARQRMGLGLTVNTDTPSPKEQKQQGAFRLLKEGETVSTFYDLGESIYCGGARVKVLNAKRLTDGTDVVIKVRSKHMHRHGERGWREVMSQLHGVSAKNNHVLDILEILEDASSFYIVMPKCDGGELFNFLVTEAEVPESECKRIIREILYAVGHLHENNLIHRDVKPENILFDMDKTTILETPKTVKLIDFDTCMEWTPVTPKSRNFVGTPGYIAPEALMGQACPQSDLWSVGVICYILMTGETPWTSIETLEDGTVGSKSALRMYNSIKTAEVDWTSEPWPDFPLARDLCQKLMAFDTEERAFSVQEALDHPWLQ